MFQSYDRLRVFYYVFSQKSIVGAAEYLNVTQSAVSQSLQKLEDEIQSPLFTRLHKKLIPTAAGIKLFPIVESFMSEMDVYLRDLMQSKEFPFGELKIGAPSEFGKAYLSSIIAKFREQFPDVIFSLEFGQPDKLMPLLSEGAIDFVLLDEFLADVANDGSSESFLLEPIIKEEIILVCSKNYFKNRIKGDLSFSRLLQQDFIAFKHDMQMTRRWFNHHFSKPALKARAVLTVDNFESVLSAVMNDAGLGIVASHLVKEEVLSGSLIHIKTDKADIVNTISLVQLRNKVPTLTESVFVKFLIDSIQRMTVEHQVLSDNL